MSVRKGKKKSFEVCVAAFLTENPPTLAALLNSPNGISLTFTSLTKCQTDANSRVSRGLIIHTGSEFDKRSINHFVNHNKF